jgi:hypothetical protein
MSVSNTEIKTGKFNTYLNISGEEQSDHVLFLHGSGQA